MSMYIENLGKNQDFEVKIMSSKNSILPLMMSCMLVKGKTIFSNVSKIEDVKNICKLLNFYSIETVFTDDGQLIIYNNGVEYKKVPKKLTENTRYSFMLLGILNSLYGKADIGYPGGCSFGGQRQLDIHFDTFRKLNVKITLYPRQIKSSAKSQNKKVIVSLRYPSVGATMNIILLGVKSDRYIHIKNCAYEPEVDDLINFMNACGGHIQRLSPKEIIIKGVFSLNGTFWIPIPDRIEAFTYAILAVILNNNIKITNVNQLHILQPLKIIREMGVLYEFNINTNTLVVFGRNTKSLSSVAISTEPYPGFPTDLHPLFTSLCLKADGTSTIRENVSPQRFSYINELISAGAELKLIDNSTLQIKGPCMNFKETKMSCTDLRGGMACILLALLSQKRYLIENTLQINRGYHYIFERLKSIGVNVKDINSFS